MFSKKHNIYGSKNAIIRRSRKRQEGTHLCSAVMGRSLIAISGKTKGLLCLGLSCVIATRRGPSVDRLMGKTLIAATRRGPRSGRNPYCRA